MKLLLDTHILLWAANAPHHMSTAGRSLLEDPDNELYFSAASLWEISIKNSLGRPDFRVDARVLRRGLTDNGYQELAITGAHAVSVESLPPLHKDPCDRMLVAQASSEGMLLVTSDALVAQYPGSIRRI